MSAGTGTVVQMTAEELTQVLNSVFGKPPSVVTLDGYQMQRYMEMYAEFARQLSFPDYFGGNMNALWDMLTDLSWLNFTRLLLVIKSWELLLSRGAEADRLALLELLNNAGTFWATPIDSGEWWDRPGLSFHVALLDSENMEIR